ncbi:MAG TPA: hypothetical protein VEG38_09715 [Acidimicrobiia bacterium]|nr:hypothetical protein [Acidimicrobiia bacterium]
MKKWFSALVVGGLVLGTVPAVGALSDEEFFKLAGRRNWLSFADARPVSPFFGIPGELRPGVPFARSYLDASPGRSECFAALYYPDEVVEEGVLQTTGHYENRTLARSQNPDVGRGTEQEVAPFGMVGPHAVTKNPTRTECFSEAASAVTPAPGELMVDGGFAQTHAVFDGDKTLTDEAVSRVTGVTAGPIRIASMETKLKLEYILDGEPVISYAMTIAGLENANEPVAGIGAQGITIAGQNVAGRDLIEQFNSEAAKAGATFKEQAWADYIQLVTPAVQKDSDGGVHVTGPALEVGQVNTSRQGQGGSHFGLRLGYASAYALLNSLDGGEADAGGVPPDLLSGSGPGSGSGSPLEGEFGEDSSATVPPALSAVPSTAASSDPLGTSAAFGLGAGTGSSGLGSSGYAAGASTGSGVADGAATAGADQAAAATEESALPLLGAGNPQAGGTASAQLAVAESRRAARNTANGLLGGILLLLGSMVWAVGMAVFGKKA